MDGPFRVVALSDAAFKKEDNTGHAVRGCAVVLMPSSGTMDSDLRNTCVHLIDYASRKQRHVTRSTFAAELFAATDAFDQLWNVAVAWHEVKCGPQTAAVIRQLREQGGLDPQTAICVDALSVHAAVVAQHVKAPAESNLLGHVQFLRELLDTCVDVLLLVGHS